MAYVDPVIVGEMEMVTPDLPRYVEMVLAKDQPQYHPLPVAVETMRPDVPVIVRYRLSADELAKILEGADICLTQLTFGRGYHPINIQVVGQEENPQPTEEVT